MSTTTLPIASGLPAAPVPRAPFALFDPWVWRMAWRDSRRSRGRLLVFSTALTLGVAALVAIGSVGWNLQRAITEQARTLVGADLIVESRHPLTPDAQKVVDDLGGTDRAYETRLVSMAAFPRTGGQRLTQVRAMEGGYPFYGKIDTEPADAAARMLSGQGAVVEESLLLQYSLHPGDTLTLGGETFPILGTIKKLPGEVNMFAGIAPRLLIARAHLPASLLSRGSIVRYFTYLQLPPSVSAPQLVAEHKADFEKYQLDTDDVDHRKRQMGRVFDDVTNFLSLVSFIALLLGGIGVASAINAHVKQKLRTVAVLRCLGASSGQTLTVYFLQAISLGVVGSLIGAAAGLFFQSLTPLFLKEILPVELTFGISWGSVVEGLVVGFLTCAIFVLLPLLPVRRTPPLLALRAAFEPAAKGERRRDPALWAAWALLVVALLVFPWVQSRNLRLGLGFSAALFVSFGLLALTAYGLMAAAKRYFPRHWPFEWRQGVGNLYRPNNRTLLLVFSLGLSTFLLLGMYLTKDVLLRQFSAQGDAKTQPNLIFFDIQPEQQAPIAAAVQAHGMSVLDAAPAITMRLTSIDGKSAESLADAKKPVRREDGEQGRNDSRWRLRHEYRSTFRDHLTVTETVTEGQFRGKAGPEADGTDVAHATPVSVEEDMAKELNLHLGTPVVWDVQSMPVYTVVGSVRKVDWSRFQSNFFVVFPAGVLEAAPAFNILVTRAPDPAASAQLQADVVQRFPGVSAVDLRLVVETIQGIVDKATTAVRFLSIFTVGTGLLVLAAAIFTGRYERVKEGVLLRTLGASRKQIFRILIVEYLALGTLAALTGILLAAAGNWVLAVFFFKLPWVPSLGAMALAWIMVTALTVGIGLFASRGVCDHPPLEILRGEE